MLLSHSLSAFKTVHLLCTHLVHLSLSCLPLLLINWSFQLGSNCKEIQEPFVLLVPLQLLKKLAVLADQLSFLFLILIDNRL